MTNLLLLLITASGCFLCCTCASSFMENYISKIDNPILKSLSPFLPVNTFHELIVKLNGEKASLEDLESRGWLFNMLEAHGCKKVFFQNPQNELICSHITEQVMGFLIKQKGSPLIVGRSISSIVAEAANRLFSTLLIKFPQINRHDIVGSFNLKLADVTIDYLVKKDFLSSCDSVPECMKQLSVFGVRASLQACTSLSLIMVDNYNVRANLHQSYWYLVNDMVIRSEKYKASGLNGNLEQRVLFRALSLTNKSIEKDFLEETANLELLWTIIAREAVRTASLKGNSYFDYYLEGHHRNVFKYQPINQLGAALDIWCDNSVKSFNDMLFFFVTGNIFTFKGICSARFTRVLTAYPADLLENVNKQLFAILIDNANHGTTSMACQFFHPRLEIVKLLPKGRLALNYANKFVDSQVEKELLKLVAKHRLEEILLEELSNCDSVVNSDLNSKFQTLLLAISAKLLKSQHRGEMLKVLGLYRFEEFDINFDTRRSEASLLDLFGKVEPVYEQLEKMTNGEISEKHLVQTAIDFVLTKKKNIIIPNLVAGNVISCLLYKNTLEPVHLKDLISEYELSTFSTNKLKNLISHLNWDLSIVEQVQIIGENESDDLKLIESVLYLLDTGLEMKIENILPRLLNSKEDFKLWERIKKVIIENFTPETPYGRFTLTDRFEFSRIIADIISNNDTLIRNSLSTSLCLKKLDQKQMLKLFQLALSSTMLTGMANKVIRYLSKVKVLNGRGFLRSIRLDLHLPSVGEHLKKLALPVNTTSVKSYLTQLKHMAMIQQVLLVLDINLASSQTIQAMYVAMIRLRFFKPLRSLPTEVIIQHVVKIMAKNKETLIRQDKLVERILSPQFLKELILSIGNSKAHEHYLLWDRIKTGDDKGPCPFSLFPSTLPKATLPLTILNNDDQITVFGVYEDDMDVNVLFLMAELLDTKINTLGKRSDGLPRIYWRFMMKEGLGNEQWPPKDFLVKKLYKAAFKHPLLLNSTEHAIKLRELFGVVSVPVVPYPMSVSARFYLSLPGKSQSYQWNELISHIYLSLLYLPFTNNDIASILNFLLSTYILENGHLEIVSVANQIRLWKRKVAFDQYFI